MTMTMKSEENERAAIGLKSCCCPSSPSPLLLALQRTGVASRVAWGAAFYEAPELPSQHCDYCASERTSERRHRVRVEAGGVEGDDVTALHKWLET